MDVKLKLKLFEERIINCDNIFDIWSLSQYFESAPYFADLIKPGGIVVEGTAGNTGNYSLGSGL